MESLTNEELIARYAYEHPEPPGFRLQVSRVPKLVPEPLPELPSNTLKGMPDRGHGYGDLNRLPDEVLHIVIQNLDIQSAARFSCASVRCAQLLLSNISFTDLVRLVPEALAGLREVGILGLHSIGSLHAALLSDACAGCGRFGAFLFLIECERCCWLCADYNCRLWPMLRETACDSYGLWTEEIMALPALRMGTTTTNTIITTITSPEPGEEDHAAPVREERRWVVGARAAAALALRVHGSEDAVRDHLGYASSVRLGGEHVRGRLKKRRLPGPIDWERRRNVLRAGIALTQQYSHESAAQRQQESPECVADRECRGWAYVGFPCLRGGTRDGREMDRGFWCAGCSLMAVLSQRDSNWPSTPEWQHKATLRNEMSKESFLEHVRSCSHLARSLQVFGEEGIQRWRVRR